MDYSILNRHEPELIASSLATYVLGDVITTYVGINILGLHEANPAVNDMLSKITIEHMMLMKSIVILVAFVFWLSMSDKRKNVIPLSILCVGIALILWNTYMIVTVA